MMQNPVDSPERRYKVVVWATGRVGKLAIRPLLIDPTLILSASGSIPNRRITKTPAPWPRLIRSE
jgi:hypothetical protein